MYSHYYSPRARSSLLALVVNKVLLVHSHSHLSRNCPGLLPYVTTAELSSCDRDHMASHAKHIKPSDPSQKKLGETNKTMDLEVLCKLKYLYEI